MSGDGPIRVAVIEDRASVRMAIQEAIEGSGIRIVGEAGSGEQGIDVALQSRPDVLLVDIDLPGISGLEVVRELAPLLPATRIVMLTVSDSRQDLIAAVSAGAQGYLTKDLTPAALVRSIQAAAAGELAMPRDLAADVVRHLGRTARGPASAQLEELTTRELEVLRLLADGLTDRDIAAALSISIRTVESHVANILRKTGARNRAAAARMYVEP